MPFVSLLPLLLAAASLDTGTVKVPAPPVFKFAGDLGYVSTAGNSSVQTLNFGDRISAKAGDLTFSQQFNVVYGRSKGVAVTSLYRAGLRVDLAMRPTFGLYAAINYERNTFAGLRSRIGNTLGLTALLLKSPRNRFSIEGGISLTSQRGIPPKGRDLDFLGGRAASSFSHQLSSKASISQFIELLPNFRQTADLRINTESVLTAPVSKHVSVRFSYIVRYDGLPEPGFLGTDRLFTSGLQVSF